MIILKHADGIRCMLEEKLIKQCNLNQAQINFYLDIILDEIQNNSCIVYDFEAVNYCKERISEIDNDI